MRTTVAQLAELVGGQLHGDGATVITNVADLAQARAGDVSFAYKQNVAKAPASGASALLVPEIVAGFSGAQIIVPHPYLAFTKILAAVAAERADLPEGVHATAVIHKSAKADPSAAFGPFAVVGANAVIGARARIAAHAVIGANCSIGADTVIHPHATIREGTVIGARVVIHAGTTIGGDGFGYIQHEGRHVKVPQVGTVEIGDDCEIGSHCTIARATMGKTVIGRGVKIDNHSHIAHNCVIGDDCLLVAYARMGGGTVLGKGVMLAEDVGITDHVTLGNGCIVAGSAKVTKDVPAGAVVWGFPAQELRREKRERASVRRLPELFDRVKKIEQRLAETD